jgi:hypothetical protein
LFGVLQAQAEGEPKISVNRLAPLDQRPGRVGGLVRAVDTLLDVAPLQVGRSQVAPVEFLSH